MQSFNMGKKNQKLNLSREMLYSLYVEQRLTSKEVAGALGCCSSSVRNYLRQYGIPVRQNGEAVKLERSKWTEEQELSRSQNVHKAWAKKTPEEKREIQLKKMRSGKINSPESIQKAYLTKKAHRTNTSSQSEEMFYRRMLLCGIAQDDIERHYSDERYPYDCDFYIKSKDLYVEYQGHQTHGYEPYNLDSQEHQAYLRKMLDKGYDMTTWVTRDVKKLRTAISNKIKLLLIYPCNNAILVNDGVVLKLGKSNSIDINDIY